MGRRARGSGTSGHPGEGRPRRSRRARSGHGLSPSRRVGRPKRRAMRRPSPSAGPCTPNQARTRGAGRCGGGGCRRWRHAGGAGCLGLGAGPGPPSLQCYLGGWAPARHPRGGGPRPPLYRPRLRVPAAPVPGSSPLVSDSGSPQGTRASSPRVIIGAKPKTPDLLRGYSVPSSSSSP